MRSHAWKDGFANGMGLAGAIAFTIIFAVMGEQGGWMAGAGFILLAVFSAYVTHGGYRLDDMADREKHETANRKRTGNPEASSGWTSGGHQGSRGSRDL